jgi:hypothetical protein
MGSKPRMDLRRSTGDEGKEREEQGEEVTEREFGG